jgi:hypothetical protein
MYEGSGARRWGLGDIGLNLDEESFEHAESAGRDFEVYQLLFEMMDLVFSWLGGHESIARQALAPPQVYLIKSTNRPS